MTAISSARSFSEAALLAHPGKILLELDRLDAEESHLDFTRRFFEARVQSPFLVGPHHRVMCDALDRVFTGEINRLIINIPPGYTKTELAVIYAVARGLALNGKAKFIHASFSAPLALENSSAVRDVVKLASFQEMWPRQIRSDTDAKGLWRTREGGGLMAAAAGGAITGFRAGTLQPGFSGALIIDDPLKPDDAKRDSERENVNNRWHSTFKSRLAHEGVPVIVIMQRLHVDDFCGFLLKGGAGCKWHHLMMPVLIDNSVPYPEEYTHGIPIPHGLPDGPLWEVKHNREQIKLLELDPFSYAGQYKQIPIVSGGNLFKEDWIVRYADLPPLQYRWIYADTAQKTNEWNDYSVLQCWGKGVDGCAYLIDQMRQKFEAPELEKAARTFWAKQVAATTPLTGPVRAMSIEDKASGTGLIQQLKRVPAWVQPGDGYTAIPVIAIPRDTDKVRRAKDVLPAFAAGLVRFPKGEPWMTAYQTEMLAFPSGSHDDQVDATLDAVGNLLDIVNGVPGQGFLDLARSEMAAKAAAADAEAPEEPRVQFAQGSMEWLKAQMGG